MAKALLSARNTHERSRGTEATPRPCGGRTSGRSSSYLPSKQLARNVGSLPDDEVDDLYRGAP